MGELRRRLAVVDRHALFAEALTHALERHGYRVRGVLSAALAARPIVQRIEASRPDLVLVSTELGGGNGRRVIASLVHTGHRVIALVEREEPQLVGEALSLGVAAVVTESRSLEELLDVFDGAMEARPRVAPGRDELVQRYHQRQQSLGFVEDRIASLSPQERDLLAHLMEGRVVSEVARVRQVSMGTVRTQARSVMSKLEVSSQLSAVALAWRAGYDPSALHLSRARS
ncbi:MAG: response regulator transcription factor [Nocardioides sp.]